MVKGSRLSNWNELASSLVSLITMIMNINVIYALLGTFVFILLSYLHIMWNCLKLLICLYINLDYSEFFHDDDQEGGEVFEMN